MQYGRNYKIALLSAVLLMFFVFPLLISGQKADSSTQRQAPTPLTEPPLALSRFEVPLPDLDGIVTDMAGAVALGKALFWDMQVGSDNQSCASCHFHAGSDNRTKNQLTPGLLRVDDPTREPDPDHTFGDANGLTGSGRIAGPNYNLRPDDFPFFRLENELDRNSPVAFETNDVVSSQGSFGGFLLVEDPNPARFPDFCGRPDSEIFEVDGVPVRKVEPMKTPTVINAVFNHRSFHDGRANNVFNGIDPFGPRNANARVVVLDGNNPSLEVLALINASLASQAVGPPLNDFEMACAGRTFPDLGRGLLPLRALATQRVHQNDSVLGDASGLRHESGIGLVGTYEDLIRQIFDSRYWGAQGTFRVDVQEGQEPQLVSDPAGHTQMELNFSMFFGIAVMLYQATLVSDQAPYDDFMELNPNLRNFGQGTIAGAQVAFVDGFGQRELLGLDVFLNKGLCYECHNGPTFSSATVRQRGIIDRPEDEFPEPIERMPMLVDAELEPLEDDVALYDGGFYNIGVRPTLETLGVGGVDPFGIPLSFSRQAAEGNLVDEIEFDPDLFEVPGDIEPGERVAVDGAFKTPNLRNVELTAPYMHNGGMSTLRQVMDFYNRGGNQRNVDRPGVVCPEVDGETISDTSGFGDQGDFSDCHNIHPSIMPLDLTEEEIDAVIAFMLALTDPRVRFKQAPFDHPELRVSNGHPGNQFSVIPVAVEPKENSFDDVRALDSFRIIPAVGAEGSLAPLRTFLRLNHFTGQAPPPSIAPSYLPLLFDDEE